MAEPTPWPAMVRLALALGVPPDLFWRLSLAEWRALTTPADTKLTRGALAALMQRFPDKKT